MPETVYNDGLNLPYSLEAEQAVLGSVLMDPECINQVADVLRPEYFYLPEHQAIYRVMSAKMMESQTVKTHVSHVLKKLKISRRTQVRDAAQRLHFIDR